MRLDKYLCDCNIGTRSVVKDIIKKGAVKVNGIVIKKNDFSVNELKDLVTFQEKELSYNRFYYYILNKPAGVVTATNDNHDKTVMDLLKGKVNAKDLFPVGRLDKDTEGLLLITNDGPLAHNLLSPKKHVDKKYYVETENDVSQVDAQKLEAGVDIGDDKLTEKAIVNIIEPKKIYLTIHEGRFHQVKRMLEAVNNKVTYLKRVSFGNIVLDDSLPLGEFRELTEDEVKNIR